MADDLTKTIEKNRRALKRDKVFGMCAETRRQHREADRKKCKAQIHTDAYASALGISRAEAMARIASQKAALTNANCH